MRETKRIERICSLIKELWNIHPDQRLGQLLYNYVFGCGDIFVPEDDKIENKLKKIIKYYQNSQIYKSKCKSTKSNRKWNKISLTKTDKDIVNILLSREEK